MEHPCATLTFKSVFLEHSSLFGGSKFRIYDRNLSTDVLYLRTDETKVATDDPYKAFGANFLSTVIL